MLQLLNPGKQSLVPIVQEAAWGQSGIGHFGENLDSRVVTLQHSHCTYCVIPAQICTHIKAVNSNRLKLDIVRRPHRAVATSAQQERSPLNSSPLAPPLLLFISRPSFFLFFFLYFLSFFPSTLVILSASPSSRMWYILASEVKGKT
jgi:hypothetical protein